MQLRRRGEKWYLRGTYDGERVEVCTGLTDRKAAEAWARLWERDRADPDGANRRAAAAVTVQQAVDLALANVDAEHKAGNLAAATVDFYERKLGHVLRVLGPSSALAGVDAAAVDRYIATRRAEAALNLGYTKVEAPLSGAVSRSQVSEGTLELLIEAAGAAVAASVAAPAAAAPVAPVAAAPGLGPARAAVVIARLWQRPHRLPASAAAWP